MDALNLKPGVTYPIIAPIGHHSPKNGKTKDWLLRSVISHSTDGITATLPENRPASRIVSDTDILNILRRTKCTSRKRALEVL